MRRVKLAAYLLAWALVFLSAVVDLRADAVGRRAARADLYPDLGRGGRDRRHLARPAGAARPGVRWSARWCSGIIANVIYFAGIPSIWQEFFKGLVIVAALGFMVLEQRQRPVA